MNHAIICFALWLLLISTSALAQECPNDMTGTFHEGHWAMQDFITCTDCREVNQYPDDFRNQLWNWTLTGDGGFIYDYYMNRSVSTFGSEQLSIPICNAAGQCATGTFTVYFNVINIGIGNASVPINTSVNSMTIRITQANGDSTTDTFLPDQREAGALPIPSDSSGGLLGPDDCLNNDGTERPSSLPDIPEGGGGIPGGGGGGGSGGGSGYPDPALTPDDDLFCGPGTPYDCVQDGVA